MGKKIPATAFMLLLLSGLCQAQFYLLQGHEIQIDVDLEGNAEVSERYFLHFQNEEQLIEFRRTVSQIGVSIDAWQNYDSRVFPHIGRPGELTVNEITFVENDPELDFLEINYFLNDSLMEKKGETSRVIDFAIKAKHFEQFRQDQLWVIPQGTTIGVNLPKGAEIQETVKPDAAVQENQVVWSGYTSSNELQLNYSYFKQIASFDISQLLQQMMQSDLFLVFIGIAAIVLLVLLAKRKSIAGKIENYIVEHSDLGEEED